MDRRSSRKGVGRGGLSFGSHRPLAPRQRAPLSCYDTSVDKSAIDTRPDIEMPHTPLQCIREHSDLSLEDSAVEALPAAPLLAAPQQQDAAEADATRACPQAREEAVERSSAIAQEEESLQTACSEVSLLRSEALGLGEQIKLKDSEQVALLRASKMQDAHEPKARELGGTKLESTSLQKLENSQKLESLEDKHSNHVLQKLERLEENMNKLGKRLFESIDLLQVRVETELSSFRLGEDRARREFAESLAAIYECKKNNIEREVRGLCGPLQEPSSEKLPKLFNSHFSADPTEKHTKSCEELLKKLEVISASTEVDLDSVENACEIDYESAFKDGPVPEETSLGEKLQRVGLAAEVFAGHEEIESPTYRTRINLTDLSCSQHPSLIDSCAGTQSLV